MVTTTDKKKEMHCARKLEALWQRIISLAHSCKGGEKWPTQYQPKGLSAAKTRSSYLDPVLKLTHFHLSCPFCCSEPKFHGH